MPVGHWQKKLLEFNSFWQKRLTAQSVLKEYAFQLSS
jgi:hypothetical protein